MKITHVIQHFKIGGIEKHVLELSKEQVRQGHHIKVIALYTGGQLLSEFNQETIETKVLGIRNGHDFKKLWMLKNEITEDTDVIHFHTPIFVLHIVSMLINKKIKIVYTDHISKLMKKPKIKEQINNRLMKYYVDEYIAVSYDSKKALNRHYGISNQKIRVVNNGIPEVKVNPIKFLGDSNSKNIGFVGRLEKDKGVLKLIEIASRLKQENLTFHIYGHGSLEKHLLQYIETHKLSKTVKYHGYTTEPLKYIASFDALITLSEAEALPITIIEALLVKTPIIGFMAIGGMAEVVGDIYDLSLKNDIDFVCDALIKISKDADSYDELYKRTELGYKKYQQCYSSNVMAMKTEKIYG